MMGFPKVAGASRFCGMQLAGFETKAKEKILLKRNSFRFCSVRVVRCPLNLNVAGFKNVMLQSPTRLAQNARKSF